MAGSLKMGEKMLDIAVGAGSYRLEPAGATRVGALQRGRPP
ncbi:hypothetical protein [Novosphingobium sp. EMRT-2]|nr:hypothetical protein [Novosphingobium sp. EMRT-2]